MRGLRVWKPSLQRPYTERLPRAHGKGSIWIRHLDGGSSNVFELELTALTNPVYDLGHYGIQFVSSPRHADILLITGPLTRNMLAPARRAFAVMPEPKAIVTVGDFADFRAEVRDGDAIGEADGHRPSHAGSSDEIAAAVAGLFSDSYATATLPEDMRRAIVGHVPGDPPEPRQIIAVLLACSTTAATARHEPPRA